MRLMSSSAASPLLHQLNSLERLLVLSPLEAERELRDLLNSRHLNDAERTQVEVVLGGALYYQGRYAEMIEVAKVTLERARQLKMTSLEARALNALGLGAREQGHVLKALEYCQQSRELSVQAGDYLGEARSLFNLALLYRALPSLDQALASLLRAQELILRHQHPYFSLAVSTLLAWTFLDLSMTPQAMSVVNLFTPLAEEQNNVKFMVDLTCARAVCFVRLGQPLQARASAARAAEWAAKPGQQLNAESLRYLGLMQLALGEDLKAASALESALERADAAGQVLEQQLALRALQQVYYRIGDQERILGLSGHTNSLDTSDTLQARSA